MAEPEGIWAVLVERLDYARFVPRLVPDIERSHLRRRDGSPYTVIKNPHAEGGAGRYLQLEPADVELLDLMDGTRDVQAIVVEHLERTGTFALDRLARLTAGLGTNGFFGEERPPVYEKLSLRKALRDPLTKASLLLRRLIMWDVAHWSNADRTVDVLYRAGGRLAFTRVGGALIVLVSLAGIVVWWQEMASARHELVTLNGSYVQGILALVGLQVVSISLHEGGHALAIRHYGRRVRRLGLAIYYLLPCFYVDSTDMALGSRKQRVMVSLAGPIGGLVIGALCAFAAAAWPGTLAGELAFKAASLFVFQFVLNLLPILELDGYHVLTDLLDVPFLRQRAIGFVRASAFQKLRRRERWKRQEIGLAIYGASAIVASIAMLWLGITMWRSRFADAASELVAVGPVGILGIGVIGIVFLGPLLIALAARLVGWVRGLARAAQARRHALAEAEIVARAQLLSRVRFLNGLSRQALVAIAEHLEIERFAPGDIVVTAGEPGNKFYLVRSGRLEALSPEGPTFGTIIPGEGFGELALLDQTPRTATVRALEPTELWTLSRGAFNRWVSARFEVAARIRADREERARLQQIPFFSGLAGQELDKIAARLQTRTYAAGEDVVRSGEAADGYYVIRGGTAQVTLPDGRVVRTLGPGAAFGELALLYGGPRTATVTALTELACARLSPADFARLVQGSGQRAGEFRAATAHYVGAGLGGAVAGA